MEDPQHQASAARTRDPQLEQLLEQHLPGLRGFLRRRAPQLVLERESTEDLAQSVCREVLQHVDDGRLQLVGDASFKQWLYEAALWKIRARTRHHRTQGRDGAREAVRLDASDAAFGAAVDAHGPHASETPSRIVQTAERRAAVRAAVEALGGRDAEVLRLAVLQERPHRDVAAALGVDESHSRVLLSRALARLARVMQRDA